MAFDPRLYPRTYGLTTAWRWILLLMGGAFLAGALVFARATFTGGLAQNGEPLWVDAVFMALGLGLGAYLLGNAIRSQLVLTADTITVAGTFTPDRSLRRDDIAGMRALRTGSTGSAVIGVKLIPKQRGMKPVKIEAVYATDEAYVAWMEGIPNLDAAESRDAEEVIASDPAFGATRAERRARLKAARRVATLLTIGAIVAAILVLRYPSQPGPLVTIVAAMPWLAIGLVWRSGGLYRLYSLRYTTEARADISLLMYIPGFALAAEAQGNAHLLDWHQTAIAWAMVSAGLMFAALAVDQGLRSHPNRAIGLLLLAVPYGYGAAALADTRLDGSTPHVYRTVVRGERSSWNRRSTSYYVALAPWGPRLEPEETKVSGTLYRSAQRGDTVCVSLHPGALGFPWYAVDHCENIAAPTGAVP